MNCHLLWMINRISEMKNNTSHITSHHHDISRNWNAQSIILLLKINLSIYNKWYQMNRDILKLASLWEYFVIVLCYGPLFFLLIIHYSFSYNEWNKWIQIDDASKILFAWKGRKFLKLNDKKAPWSFIDRTIRSSWQYWTY